jgi:hypothetical protein
MRLTPRCRDITRIVLEGEERSLRLGERLVLRLHLTVCDACTRFTHQVRFMRGALGQWRQYSEGSEEETRP